MDNYKKWLRYIMDKWTLPRNMSIRAFNVLAIADITTVEQLSQAEVGELLMLKNCGARTAMEIAGIAHSLGQPMRLGRLPRNGGFSAADKRHLASITIPDVPLNCHLRALEIGTI